jgi:hypothetical protein
MTDMDAVFAEINSYPLTVRGTKINTIGKNTKVHNELPLISQSIANAVATVAWGISSPRGQANIQRSIENSVKRKFIPYMNAMARANKSSLHHAYEWGKVGQTSARLFDLTIPSASRGKANFSMKLGFRPSMSLVPLTEAQRTPNEFTGAVVEQRHVFWNKAMVMEYGQSVTVRPVKARYMAFDTPPGAPYRSKSGLTFTSKPVNIRYADRPTYHGIQNAMSAFFKGVGGRDAANSVQSYGRQVKRGAEKAAHMLTINVPSDAYAHSVASKITNAMVPSA